VIGKLRHRDNQAMGAQAVWGAGQRTINEKRYTPSLLSIMVLIGGCGGGGSASPVVTDTDPPPVVTAPTITTQAVFTNISFNQPVALMQAPRYSFLTLEVVHRPFRLFRGSLALILARHSTAGGNYGWNVREGAHCFNPSSGCTNTFIEPEVLSETGLQIVSFGQDADGEIHVLNFIGTIHQVVDAP